MKKGSRGSGAFLCERDYCFECPLVIEIIKAYWLAEQSEERGARARHRCVGGSHVVETVFDGTNLRMQGEDTTFEIVC